MWSRVCVMVWRFAAVGVAGRYRSIAAWRANVGSDTLSAYVGSWTETCGYCFFLPNNWFRISKKVNNGSDDWVLSIFSLKRDVLDFRAVQIFLKKLHHCVYCEKARCSCGTPVSHSLAYYLVHEQCNTKSCHAIATAESASRWGSH